MNRQEAIDSIEYYVDDALSMHAQPVTTRTRLVVFEIHGETVVVAVNSYLPGSTCDDAEATELATDLLEETNRFLSGETTDPVEIL